MKLLNIFSGCFLVGTLFVACTNPVDNKGIQNANRAVSSEDKLASEAASCYASCYNNQLQQSCETYAGGSSSYDACYARKESNTKMCTLHCDTVAQQMKH